MTEVPFHPCPSNYAQVEYNHYLKKNKNIDREFLQVVADSCPTIRDKFCFIFCLMNVPGTKYGDWFYAVFQAFMRHLTLVRRPTKDSWTEYTAKWYWEESEVEARTPEQLTEAEILNRIHEWEGVDIWRNWFDSDHGDIEQH